MTRPEQALQQAVAAYLWRALPPEWAWTAIGHGGGGKIRGGILKSMGLRRGVPDILIFCPKKWREYRVMAAAPFVPCGIALELKSADGRVSKEQREFQDLLALAGWAIVIARDVATVYDELRALGVPLRAKIAA